MAGLVPEGAKCGTNMVCIPYFTCIYTYIIFQYSTLCADGYLYHHYAAHGILWDMDPPVDHKI